MEAEGEGHSGYMAEEPGNTPAWRRVPEHLKKLRLPTLLYDGTAADDPNDSYEGGIVGQWSAKMRKYGKVGNRLLPGYDGAVSGFYAPLGGSEDAPEDEHEVEMSPEQAAAIAAEKSQRRKIRLLQSERALRAIAKEEKASLASGVSDPRSGGAGSHSSTSDPTGSHGGGTTISFAPGSPAATHLSALKVALFKWGQKAAFKAGTARRVALRQARREGASSE